MVYHVTPFTLVLVFMCILTITFPYTGVSDYTSVSRMVTFSSRQSSASVSVPITNDNVIEASEMFSGSLSAVTENVDIEADTAIVTIMDDDGDLMSILCYIRCGSMYPIFLLVIVSFDPTSYTVTEGIDRTAVLLLVRSGNLNREVVVSVTIESGTATGMAEWRIYALTHPTAP